MEAAGEQPLRSIGWSPFSLPGERRLVREISSRIERRVEEISGRPGDAFLRDGSTERQEVESGATSRSGNSDQIEDRGAISAAPAAEFSPNPFVRQATSGGVGSSGAPAATATSRATRRQTVAEAPGSRGWSWLRSQRSRQRNRERAEAELIDELRWQWRSACLKTPLAKILYTPSGATRVVPMIDHVDLGPPLSLTVKRRPGQTVADFVAAAPTIASEMGVLAIEVVPLTAHWVRLILLPTPAISMPSGADW